MQRLAGRYLAEVWDHLPLANQLRLVTDLGRSSRSCTPCQWTVWTRWTPIGRRSVADRIHGCVARHREQGMPEAWLEQLPAYLAHAQPLYPPSFAPAIVSGDIHQYHLLVDRSAGPLAARGVVRLRRCADRVPRVRPGSDGTVPDVRCPQLLRAFLQVYGYADADLTDALSHRLLAYTLLHRYRRFTWVRDEVVGDRTARRLRNWRPRSMRCAEGGRMKLGCKLPKPKALGLYSGSTAGGT